MTKRDQLTVERVRAAISYDPETGICTRLYDPSKTKEWNTRWAGKPAGALKPKGYRTITIDLIEIEEHRIIWAYMTGEWPTHTVDHRDLDKSNNRWGNLRHATKSEQQHNRAARRNNPAGMKGVTRLRNGKFMARRTENGKDIFLGNFPTAEVAHAAYCAAASQAHGQFFRSE